MTGIQGIRSLLEEYNFFEECIIEDVRFSEYLIDVEVDFNYVYDPAGTMRDDIENKRIVTLKLSRLKGFEFESGLSFDGNMDFNQIDWGINEISIAEIEESETTMSGSIYELSLLWENERKIKVKFLEASVFKPLFKK